MLDDHPCFDEIDDEELELIRMGLVPKNTKKSEKKCEQCPMAYLKQKGKPQDYWNYKEQELDKVLGKFWFEAKTKKGEKYTVSSLLYDLNRGLK